MLRKSRKIALGVLVLFAMFVFSTVSAAAVIEHTAVIKGNVSAIGLVTVGTNVQEGDILVNVETKLGTAPTARAKVNGKVVEVLVRPGTRVETGQVIVRIEPSNP